MNLFILFVVLSSITFFLCYFLAFPFSHSLALPRFISFVFRCRRNVARNSVLIYSTLSSFLARVSLLTRSFPLLHLLIHQEEKILKITCFYFAINRNYVQNSFFFYFLGRNSFFFGWLKNGILFLFSPTNFPAS